MSVYKRDTLLIIPVTKLNQNALFINFFSNVGVHAFSEFVAKMKLLNPFNYILKYSDTFKNLNSERLIQDYKDPRI